MQFSEPTPVPHQRGTVDASVVEVLFEQQRLMLEREEKLRQEMQRQVQAERAAMEATMEAMAKQIEASKPVPPLEAIPEQRLVALQARLEALHAAKLLNDDELYSLEDMVADFVEFESSKAVVVTLETINVDINDISSEYIVPSNENARKLLKLVALSERLVADGAFARQARRKYV